MRYVNLGCGSRHHPEWVNMDLVPSAPGVIACDLSRGIPLPDAHCDVVYHSHVLEHLRRDSALPFLRECHRVLKPAGILRVVVPDLEQVCREYLTQLQAARAREADAEAKYEWITIELLDQLVRERSGGGMIDFVRRSAMSKDAYARTRIGDEIQHVVDSLGRDRRHAGRTRLRKALEGIRLAYDRLVCMLLFRRDAARALQIGRFRLSGENHQWMYDAHSLGQLLLAAGFEAAAVRTAESSAIPGWSRYRLDLDAEGRASKPESLFMEAVRAA